MIENWIGTTPDQVTASSETTDALHKFDEEEKQFEPAQEQ